MCSLRCMKLMTGNIGGQECQMELLNKWRYKRFGDFAGEFGLVFKSKINALNESSLEGNLFSVNPLQRFIDNVIMCNILVF